MAEILRLHDLTVAYDRHPAVHHLCGAFTEGSLTAVVGPNGAGKSTLLRAIKGLMPVSRGRIECRVPLPEIAYLPQQAALERSFPISTLEVVMLGHWRRCGAFGGLGRGEQSRAREALAAVGLGGFERRSIDSLSAGQFQRLLFARVLLEDARLILLDEPFTAIDARTTAELLEVIKRWHGEQRTVIAVLHDFEQVRAHFPETLLLAREGIAWGDTAEVMTARNLMRARAMAEAWDDDAEVCHRGAA